MTVPYLHVFIFAFSRSLETKCGKIQRYTLAWCHRNTPIAEFILSTVRKTRRCKWARVFMECSSTFWKIKVVNMLYVTLASKKYGMIIDLTGSKCLLLFVDHVTFLAERFLSIKTIENEYDLLWLLNVRSKKSICLIRSQEKGVAQLPNSLYLSLAEPREVLRFMNFLFLVLF